jgi:hypothetical protein
LWALDKWHKEHERAKVPVDGDWRLFPSLTTFSLGRFRIGDVHSLTAISFVVRRFDSSTPTVFLIFSSLLYIFCFSFCRYPVGVVCIFLSLIIVAVGIMALYLVYFVLDFLRSSCCYLFDRLGGVGTTGAV